MSVLLCQIGSWPEDKSNAKNTSNCETESTQTLCDIVEWMTRLATRISSSLIFSGCMSSSLLWSIVVLFLCERHCLEDVIIGVE